MLESFDDKLLISKTASLQQYKTRRRAHSIDLGVLPQRIKKTATSTRPPQPTGNKPERETSRVPVPSGSTGWEPAKMVPTSSVFNEAVLSKQSGPYQRSDQDPVREAQGHTEETELLLYGDSLSGASIYSEGADDPPRHIPESRAVYDRDCSEEGSIHRVSRRYSDSLRSWSPVPVDCAAAAAAETRAESIGRLSFDNDAEQGFSVAPLYDRYKPTAAQSPPPPRSGIPRPSAMRTRAARVSNLAKHYEQLSREFEKQREIDDKARELWAKHYRGGSLRKMAVETPPPMQPPSPARLASGDFIDPNAHEMSRHQASSLSPMPSDLSYQEDFPDTREDWEGAEYEPSRDDVSFDDEYDLNLNVLDVGMETEKGDVEMGAWLERMTNAVGVDWTSA